MNAVSVARERIAAAARRAGRDPGDVLLLGATKTVDAGEILRAVRDGLRCVGENRVQELVAKQQQLGAEPDARDLRWDLIGPLQRNKVNKVVGTVTTVHGLDTPALAEAIGARAVALGVTQDVLLEVNTSGEASKHGVEPGDALDAARAVAAVAGIRLCGAMTLAAPGDLDASRRSFAALAALVAGPTWPGGKELSMGMSDDFEIAVEEGATIVRLGSALF